MNESSASAWSAAEQFDPLGGAAADQDFGNLLDFDNINLDFQIDPYHNVTEHDANQQLTELADSLDVQHLQNHFSPQVHPNHSDGGVGTPHQMGGSGIPHGNNFFDFSMPPYSQANAPAFTQAQDHMYRPHAGVPPTPNSVEMHGDPSRYLKQMDPQQAMFEQRFHMRREDAVCLD